MSEISTKQLILKMVIYAILMVMCLELLVRAFHLTKDCPKRYVDAYGVEKWAPHPDGNSVTGNRRQIFSPFPINASGFNSFHEFNPSKTAY